MEKTVNKTTLKLNSVWKDIWFLVRKIIIIIISCILLFTFLFGFYHVNDISMKPAVNDGDLVIFYRLDKSYTVSDNVILKYQGEKQIRRVVAIAGDVVDITETGLHINGYLQKEEGIYSETNAYVEGIHFPITVGENQIFVLADSRENATDSRVYGVVDVKDTLGKVVFLMRRKRGI